MTRFLCALGLVALLSSPDLAAQDGDVTVTFSGVQRVDFDGEFRMRAESRDSGLLGPGEGTTVPTRFRAGFNLEVDDYVSTYLQFQAHAPDLGTQVDGQIHQAYTNLAQITSFFDFQVGRFEMDYGQGRMVSSNNFSNTGRSWDGFRASHKDEGYSLDLFWTRPVVGQATENGDETFGGFYYERSLDVFDLDAYALKRATDARNDTTLGFIASSPDWADEETDSGIGWSLEFATQSADGSEDGSAMAVAANYMLGGGLEVGVGLDTASGGNGDFQPLYNDEFYWQGTADLFQWTNLTDAYGWVVKPMNDKWNFYGSLHSFSEDVATPGSSDALGTEIDLGIWGNLNEATEAWMGLSRYSGDNRDGTAADQVWLVGSITVNF